MATIHYVENENKDTKITIVESQVENEKKEEIKGIIYYPKMKLYKIFDKSYNVLIFNYLFNLSDIFWVDYNANEIIFMPFNNISKIKTLIINIQHLPQKKIIDLSYLINLKNLFIKIHRYPSPIYNGRYIDDKELKYEIKINDNGCELYMYHIPLSQEIKGRDKLISRYEFKIYNKIYIKPINGYEFDEIIKKII